MFANFGHSVGRMHWLAFFSGVLVCWIFLFRMALPPEVRALEAIYGASILEILCGGTLGNVGFLSAFVMWSLMSAAMMAPTALPAFSTYDDLGTVGPTNFGNLVAGYLVAWFGFSLLAAALQITLFRLELIGGLGQSLSTPLTMLFLIGAGLYQFTALKQACLSRCRAPLTFFIQHWNEGPFRNGLRLGLDCVGCCWVLMLLGFVGGAMNLGFMGLAMLLMTVEKLPEIGRFITKPLGVVLCASGLALPFF